MQKSQSVWKWMASEHEQAKKCLYKETNVDKGNINSWKLPINGDQKVKGGKQASSLWRLKMH